MKQGLFILVFLIFLPLSSHAVGTYYIDSDGSDANNGTSAATPKKTWSAVRGLLTVAGDTIIVLDGTYTKSVNGTATFTCGTNAPDGTALANVTIRAQNERQARIKGDGTAPALELRSCDYWTIQGLTLENADKVNTIPVAGETSAGGGFFYHDTNLTIKRNIFARNNRYNNTHCAHDLSGVNNLYEENEFYYCHRHGLALGDTTGTIVRRNYFHSRGYADISPCDSTDGVPKCSGQPTMGDDAITCYPCRNEIYENNITEGWMSSVSFQATNNLHDVSMYGHISNGDQYGAALVKTRPEAGQVLNAMPRNVLIKDTVSYNSTYPGVWGRNAKNLQCTNCSLIYGGTGFSLDTEGTVNIGDSQPSGFATNLLAAYNSSRPVAVSDQYLTTGTWGVNNIMIYGNGSSPSPALTDPKYTGLEITSTEPGLGTCKIYRPVGSAAKTNNMGADVVYKYNNGTLTSTPLWDPVTNRFTGCGATVNFSTLNTTSAGNSCINVHERLNVNTNGCTVPLGAPPAGPFTYYIDDTTGSDSDTGLTTDLAWATFAHAVDILAPGDTLVVMNGSYTGSNTLQADCSTSGTANDGTVDAPITIQAQNARQATLYDSTGVNDAVNIKNCSYWNIKNLVVRNGDGTKGATQSGHTVYVESGDHVNLEGLLITTPNRSYLANGILFAGGGNNTVLNTEIYDFHRGGLQFQGSSGGSTVNNIARNIYFNSRDRADNGAATTPTTRGDFGFRCFSCDSLIAENLVIEDVEIGFILHVVNDTINNSFYNSGIRNVATGVQLLSNDANETGVAAMVQNTTIGNVSVSGASTAGFHFQSAKNTLCRQCTAINGTAKGFLLDEHSTDVGDDNPTFTLSMPMIKGNTGAGYDITGHDTSWTDTTKLTYLWYYSNGTAVPALTDARVVGELTSDPQLGTCIAYIPQSSPAGNAGQGGDHIGTHLDVTTLNGQDTTTDMWTPDFIGCGVQVTGINDTGEYCLTADQRFLMEYGGCPLSETPVPIGTVSQGRKRLWRTMPMSGIAWQ